MHQCIMIEICDVKKVRPERATGPHFFNITDAKTSPAEISMNSAVKHNKLKNYPLVNFQQVGFLYHNRQIV